MFQPALEKTKSYTIKKRVIFFFTFLITFSFFVLFLPSLKNLYAACYCVDPVGDNCWCATTPPPSATYPSVINTGSVQVMCDSQHEANYFFNVRNPICGNNAETIPYCSRMDWDNQLLMCWGTSFDGPLTPSGIPPDTMSWYALPGPTTISFNTGTWPSITSIWTCASSLHCCTGDPEDAQRCIDEPLPFTACGVQRPDYDPSNPAPFCSEEEPSYPGEMFYSNPDPFPEPYVPCNEIRPQEFHSLRPYQASPCKQEAEDLALFCGSDFILLDNVLIQKTYYDELDPPFGSYPLYWTYSFEGQPISAMDNYSPEAAIACGICNSQNQCVPTDLINCIPEFGCMNNQQCEAGFCIPNDNGTETCTFVIDRENDIAIDLQMAELPIMGYTELSMGAYDTYKVINSLYQDETVSDAEKMNEYVSWYLNGVIGRAEYDPPDPETEEGHRKIVDFSGPLKKLLAFESQIEKRWQEVEKAILSSICDPDAEDHDPFCIRHNQIIACHLSGDPTKCYDNEEVVGYTRILDWPSRPPLQRDYESFNLYEVALENWRSSNLWRLFSYIPFSSTEDRVGEVEIFKYSIQPPLSSDIIILRSDIRNQIPAELFFPHMEESVELADLLQRLFSSRQSNLEAGPSSSPPPLDPLCDPAAVRKNPGDALFGTELSATIEYTAQVACTFTQPGDGRVCRAAGGECMLEDKENWTCTTHYEQVDCNYGYFCGVNCSPYYRPTPQVTCLNASLPEIPPYPYSESDFYCFPPTGDWSYALPGGGECCFGGECFPAITGWCGEGSTHLCGHIMCIVGPDNQFTVSPFTYTEDCRLQVPIAFQTITKTPLADRIWTKLVYGSFAAFKRIFPQIEDVEGRPVRRLYDMPSASAVVYRSLTDSATVVSPSGGAPHIYFPHLGGVHEYFLNCTQKALRPQGYGRGCETAPRPLSHITGEGDCATPPPSDLPVGAGKCEIPTEGYCSPEYLMSVTQGYDGVGWNECQASIAAIICNMESGGNPSAINCGCLTGSTVDYSIGLFQINLLAHSMPGTNCYQAFEYSCPYWWCQNQGPILCTILDQDMVNACADYYFDPVNNILKAYELSLGGTNWTPWSTATSCATEIAALGCN